MTPEHAKQQHAKQQAGSLDPAPAEVNAVLLDLYRIGCAYPPGGHGVVRDPSVTIGSPLLERLLSAVRADGGALLLASLPETALALSAPSALGLQTIERVIALSRIRPEQLPGVFASPADGWFCFPVPLPVAGGSDAYAPDSHHPQASHAVVVFEWRDAVRRPGEARRAGVLLPALAEALRAGIGMLLLWDTPASRGPSLRTDVASVREADAAEADWQQTFDAISDPISIVDAHYQLVRANAAYQALFGDAQVAMGSHPCFSHREEQTAPCEGCPLPHTLITGQPGFVQHERWVPNKVNGQFERRIYQTWTYPARNRRGVVDHAVEIIKDVTDQERLREAMSQAEALRQADRLKAELLGTVSHELRSPLAAIRGYAETLQRHERRITRDERQEFLAAIVGASDRLQVIIDRILALSELATGTMPIQRTPIDVLPIVQEGVAACARQAERAASRPFVFSVSAQDNGGEDMPAAPLVLADPRLLRDVLDHVLENAVRYSPDGGQIRIHVCERPASVRHDQQASETFGHGAGLARKQVDNWRGAGDEEALPRPTLEITVQDSGMGIPPEHLGHIFDRFHRVDTRLTREIGGLGVGLAICQQIMRLHNGAIWAESEPGQGSTFHIVLPLAEHDALRDQVTDETETENY